MSFEEPKKFPATSPTSQTTGAGLHCDEVVVVHETTETIKESDTNVPVETNTNVKVTIVARLSKAEILITQTHCLDLRALSS